jgi:hypothetical protein
MMGNLGRMALVNSESSCCQRIVYASVIGRDKLWPHFYGLCRIRGHATKEVRGFGGLNVDLIMSWVITGRGDGRM